jgi:hypothetical protein
VSFCSEKNSNAWRPPDCPFKATEQLVEKHKQIICNGYLRNTKMGRRARSILGSCYDAGGAARGTKGTALIGGHCGTGDAHHCQRGQLLFGRVHLRRANQERPPNGERRKLLLQSDDSLIALSVREPAH